MLALQVLIVENVSAQTPIPSPESPTGPVNLSNPEETLSTDPSPLPTPMSKTVLPSENKAQEDGSPKYSDESANLPDLKLDEKNNPTDSSIDYRYDPVGKRDPFRPYRDAKVGVGQLRSTDRQLEPLENFDVKTLEVVAIIWGTERPKALIQDPSKQVHSVIKGQRIGKNDGFVAEIREGEIVVVELFDLNGKVIKESVVLPIKK